MEQIVVRVPTFVDLVIILSSNVEVKVCIVDGYEVYNGFRKYF